MTLLRFDSPALTGDHTRHFENRNVETSVESGAVSPETADPVDLAYLRAGWREASGDSLVAAHALLSGSTPADA